MTKYGKLNLLGMTAVPLMAVLSGLIVFGPRLDTAATLFVINLIPVLLGGLFSWLMLRKANNDISALIAILPTVIPALWVFCWYVFRLVSPAAIAPGAEYLGAPQYHVMAVLPIAVFSFVVGFFVRSR
ncbi:MAG: hypothetical protein P8R04_02745 [Gammaproteobacteria bacterium]|nr:hypothetical protein [Gammaproteobacteria bacterium]